MTNLTTFNYLSNSVRVVEIDGNPWFVAMDVGMILGLNLWGGVSRHLSFLSSDERRVINAEGTPAIRLLE